MNHKKIKLLPPLKSKTTLKITLAAILVIIAFVLLSLKNHKPTPESHTPPTPNPVSTAEPAPPFTLSPPSTTSQPAPIASTTPATRPATRSALITELQTMTDAARLEFVLNKIAQHETRLQNFEYQLKRAPARVVNNLTNDTENEFGGERNFLIRRKGVAILEGTIDASADTQPSLESVSSWDGHRCRGYSQEFGGFINDQLPNYFELGRFHQVLGIQIDSEKLRTLHQWATLRKETPDAGLEVKVADLDGQPLIALSAAGREPNVQPRGRATFWLDPVRDFMIVKYEYNDPYTVAEFIVKETRQVNGTWVPTKEICHWTHPRDAQPELVTEEMYTVTTFKVNTVKDADFKVIFPMGTIVQDQILKVNWTVTPNGFELTPRKDWGSTGQMVNSIMPNQAEALKNLDQPHALILPDHQSPP